MEGATVARARSEQAGSDLVGELVVRFQELGGGDLELPRREPVRQPGPW